MMKRKEVIHCWQLCLIFVLLKKEKCLFLRYHHRYCFYFLVNVTKNFKAMEMHERDVERQNFLAARKLSE